MISEQLTNHITSQRSVVSARTPSASPFGVTASTQGCD